jgi:histidyl-tRNA synthetase
MKAQVDEPKVVQAGIDSRLQNRPPHLRLLDGDFPPHRNLGQVDRTALATEEESSACQVLLIAMEQSSEPHALGLLSKLRLNNVSSELYPDRAKLKKPLNYANKKGIPVVVLIGSKEIESGNLTVKYMESGDQEEITEEQLLIKLLAT